MRYFSNIASEAVLASGVNSIVTSITLDTVTGLPVSTPFTLALDADAPSEELVSVTGVAGTTLTVVRGYDGTTAIDHLAGAVVRHVHSAGDFAAFYTHAEAESGVHGADGDIVGTTDVQTLSNKNLTASSNTFSDKVLNPAGMITAYAAAVAPTGWLICNGAAVSRSTYASLFNAIGTAFGAGDGSTTFNLPDLRGRFAMGVSAGHALATSGGAESTTLGAANLPAHTHSIDHNHASATTSTDGNHDHSHQISQSDGPQLGTFRSGDSGSSSIESTNGVLAAGDHTHTVDLPNFTGTSGSTGSGTGFSTLDPFLAVNYIIKA